MMNAAATTSDGNPNAISSGRTKPVSPAATMICGEPRRARRRRQLVRPPAIRPPTRLGRFAVGVGFPSVQRRKPHLGAEADQRKHERGFAASVWSSVARVATRSSSTSGPAGERLVERSPAGRRPGERAQCPPRRASGTSRPPRASADRGAGRIPGAPTDRAVASMPTQRSGHMMADATERRGGKKGEQAGGEHPPLARPSTVRKPTRIRATANANSTLTSVSTSEPERVGGEPAIEGRGGRAVPELVPPGTRDSTPRRPGAAPDRAPGAGTKYAARAGERGEERSAPARFPRPSSLPFPQFGQLAEEIESNSRLIWNTTIPMTNTADEHVEQHAGFDQERHPRPPG